MSNGQSSGQMNDDKKEACKTFVEQTKLLMSLASAFIVAPAAVQTFLKIKLDWRVLCAELCFIGSVVFSYVVLGAIAGTQFRGEYNLYRRAARWSGLIQFLSYIAGLCFFGLWLVTQSAKITGEKSDHADLDAEHVSYYTFQKCCGDDPTCLEEARKATTEHLTPRSTGRKPR